MKYRYLFLALATVLVAGCKTTRTTNYTWEDIKITPEKQEEKPKAEVFDYSMVSVPEEGGVKFEKITEEADAVAVPVDTSSPFKKQGKESNTQAMMKLNWWVNSAIGVSPDGKKIGYINYKNNTRNIMVKSAHSGGASVQRTFRTDVRDFSWSPDGSTLCFTEHRAGHYGIYLVNSEQGAIVQQISQGTSNDFGGVITNDGKTIYFYREEGNKTSSLWSFDRKSNLFSNYSRGLTPCIIPDNSNVVYCTRLTDKNEAEIWKLNFNSGVEEVILSQPGRSFTTPQLSPDGKWLLCTGCSISEKENIVNTDIFVIRTNGTGFTQLTYHPGNDLSAIWSPDGKSIFFLSQRGSTKVDTYNVWRMDFNL